MTTDRTAPSTTVDFCEPLTTTSSSRVLGIPSAVISSLDLTSISSLLNPASFQPWMMAGPPSASAGMFLTVVPLESGRNLLMRSMTWSCFSRSLSALSKRACSTLCFSASTPRVKGVIILPLTISSIRFASSAWISLSNSSYFFMSSGVLSSASSSATSSSFLVLISLSMGVSANGSTGSATSAASLPRASASAGVKPASTAPRDASTVTASTSCSAALRSPWRAFWASSCSGTPSSVVWSP